MKTIEVIDTELRRLLKGRSQLTTDFNNKTVNLTEEDYERRIQEMINKIDNLQTEKKEAERELKKRFDLK